MQKMNKIWTLREITFIQSKEMLYGSLYCVSLGNGSEP